MTHARPALPHKAHGTGGLRTLCLPSLSRMSGEFPPPRCPTACTPWSSCEDSGPFLTQLERAIGATERGDGLSYRTWSPHAGTSCLCPQDIHEQMMAGAKGLGMCPWSSEGHSVMKPQLQSLFRETPYLQCFETHNLHKYAFKNYFLVHQRAKFIACHYHFKPT